MRVQVNNGGRGGPPKYRLSEIAEMLGITVKQMNALIASQGGQAGGFPDPAIGFGFNRLSANGKKDYCARTYYNKKEVIDWYKKVTANK